MSLQERLYEGVLGGARPLFHAAALVNSEAGRAVRGRRASLDRFEAWAASDRDPARPLVWLHAPSVGEGLMAQAIMEALRRQRPDVQLAFTHFSPSAERITNEVGADVAGYIPWDTRGPVRRALGALRPSAIAFVRTEVWPVLTREARRSGARLFLVNAVLAEDSSRLTWPGRTFLGSVYRRLDGVGAVTEEHAERYARLGVSPGAITVTGDARFDQVTARIRDRGLAVIRSRFSGGDASPDFGSLPEESAAVLRALHDRDRFTVVAGSTWDSDEDLLVAALGVLRQERPVRFVFAPHEPTPAHLESLEERLERAGIRHARLGAVNASGSGSEGGSVAAGGGMPIPAAVVIDRLGVLADLYTIADLAYVGGGFRGAGLHSVVEPAGVGVPVLFGPRHGNAREAGALADAGGGFVVENPGDVEARVREMAEDRGLLGPAGEAAERFVRSESGAAERNAGLILRQLEGYVEA